MLHGSLAPRRPTLHSTRRTLLRQALAAAAAGALAACGGGDEETEENPPAGSGRATAPPLDGSTLVSAAGSLAQRYPRLPPSLIAELQSYSLTEEQASPNASRSFLASAWDGEIRRNGFVRIVEFQTFPNLPFASVFGNPPSVALGSAAFSGVSLRSGRGDAFVINARDGLRLNNDSLQLFLGFRRGTTQPRSVFTGVQSYLFLTVGTVRDPAGAAAGVGLSLWNGEFDAEVLLPQPDGNVLARTLNPRYRFYVLEDYLGGPLGLRNDFDSVLINRLA